MRDGFPVSGKTPVVLCHLCFHGKAKKINKLDMLFFFRVSKKLLTIYEHRTKKKSIFDISEHKNGAFMPTQLQDVYIDIFICVCCQ